MRRSLRHCEPQAKQSITHEPRGLPRRFAPRNDEFPVNCRVTCHCAEAYVIASRRRSNPLFTNRVDCRVAIVPRNDDFSQIATYGNFAMTNSRKLPPTAGPQWRLRTNYRSAAFFCKNNKILKSLYKTVIIKDNS